MASYSTMNTLPTTAVENQGKNGKCLGVEDHHRVQDGTKLIMWDCVDDAVGQEFTFDGDRLMYDGKCATWSNTGVRARRRVPRPPRSRRPGRRRTAAASARTTAIAKLVVSYNTRPVTFTAARAARVTVAPSCTRYAASPQQVPSPPHRRAANE